jgi:hypothetical protein
MYLDQVSLMTHKTFEKVNTNLDFHSQKKAQKQCERAYCNHPFAFLKIVALKKKLGFLPRQPLLRVLTTCGHTNELR